MAYISFIFIIILIEHSVASSGDPDQTPSSVASDLGLDCTPMSHKKDAMIIWVYNNLFLILDTCKQVLLKLATVKTQMKCCIRQHFTRICTVR